MNSIHQVQELTVLSMVCLNNLNYIDYIYLRITDYQLTTSTQAVNISASILRSSSRISVSSLDISNIDRLQLLLNCE